MWFIYKAKNHEKEVSCNMADYHCYSSFFTQLVGIR